MSNSRDMLKRKRLLVALKIWKQQRNITASPLEWVDSIQIELYLVWSLSVSNFKQWKEYQQQRKQNWKSLSNGQMQNYKSNMIKPAKKELFKISCCRGCYSARWYDFERLSDHFRYVERVSPQLRFWDRLSKLYHRATVSFLTWSNLIGPFWTK